MEIHVPPLFRIPSSMQFTTPCLEEDEWKEVDQELRVCLHEFHHQVSTLTSGEEVARAGDYLMYLLREFFAQRDIFNSSDRKHSETFITHDSKALQAVRREKNRLKKVAQASGAQEDRKLMFRAIKAVSCLKKEIKRRQHQKDAFHQESLYRRNFFRFAKLATNGQLGKRQMEPSFSKRDADVHYWKTYESCQSPVERDWTWFPRIKTPSVPFDLSPVTPAIVKATLKRANSNGAAGFDGISFSLLTKLPSIHHILATLFTKVLQFGCPPSSWSQAKIKLIHKGGPSTCSPSDFRMISLLPCVGKLFDLIITKRLNRYISENELVNPQVQKGFRVKCNGVVEHNLVLDGVIRAARARKRTAHLSFLDIRDAFGSVDHLLVKHTLERNAIPDIVIACIMKSLTEAQGQVITQKWSSEPFSFNSGLMQGAPLSSALFILAFNPILEWITSHEKRGFRLSNDCTVNCLAFCDDITVISSDRRFHQRLIDDLSAKLKTMGMHLKPTKSRALSICAGRPKEVMFYLNEESIPLVHEADHKFLGALISFSSNQMVLAEKLERSLLEKLSNLDQTSVRGEFKLNIYKAYVLPSIRFMLTVHSISKTYLDQLDNAAMRFMKCWSGVPRSGTRLIFHSEHFLNIPSISQLYEEAHSQALYTSIARGDTRVREALIEKVERESKLVKPTQMQGFSNTIMEAIGKDDQMSGNLLDALGESPSFSDLTLGKAKIKKLIKSKNQSRIHERARELSLQGHLLQLAAEEQCDASWKAFAFSLPKSLLKFCINSAINVLPSLSNLKRWGRSKTDKCPRCGWIETPKHLLSSCKVFLDQGRYTARHNAVLSQIVRQIDLERYTVYADLEGKTYNGGTIPPNLLVTAEKPDLVTIDKESGEVAIWELTIPFEDRLEASQNIKTTKYASLIKDLSEKTSVSFETIEIGARGYINRRNREVLRDLHTFTSGISLKDFIASIGKMALTASYHIFVSRNNSDWLDPQFDRA